MNNANNMADNFEIRYLESDHILNLYTQIYGSDKAHFCIRPDKLDIILNEIKNDDLYPSFVAKLTSLFCGILQNHLFSDGNKVMSIQTGSLFLLANGYNEIVERYESELFRLIPTIARGLIGQDLIHDILDSILGGESQYSECLQLRIFFAINEDIDDEADVSDNIKWFWFEKQEKLTARADNINSVDKKCLQYPCVKLVFNGNWNDYGHKTWYSLWYITSKNSVKYIGDVKIMNIIGDSYNRMESGFHELNDEFCSLGLDYSYYQNLLNIFGKQEAKRLLQALRDSAIDDIIYENFSKESGYRDSLLRDISSEKALREARFILENRKKTEAYSFKYNFTPVYNKDYTAIWNVPIDYEAVPYKLTYSIVGENAVGKTQLLSDFTRDLIDENNHHNFENLPLISSVLVICSSTFDSYNNLGIKRTRIPLNVCSVVQEENTSNRLEIAINRIIERGTIYKNGSVLTILEKYCRLLDTMLQNDFSCNLFEHIVVDDREQVILRNGILKECVKKMSTGQLQIFSLVTYVCAYIHLNSIVIVDEPEVHLHPRMVTHFFCTLNELLAEFLSYAVVATHSPLVVRECVDSNVYMMVRNEYDEPTIKTVPFRTFGEDLTTLYENIFGFQEMNSHFYKTIKDMINKSQYSFESILNALHGQGVQLSMNAMSTITNCINRKQ